MIGIGSCTLGERPRVALAIRDGVDRPVIERAVTAGVNIVELRIDQFSDTAPDHVRRELRQLEGIPRLGTIRSAQEGGSWTRTEAERLALFETILPDVEAVDIEFSSKEINREVVRLAKSLGKPVIGSFHDFEKTPLPNAFPGLMRQAEELDVDIIKIAAHCASRADLRLLAQVLLDHPEKKMIVLGMGPVGAPSRFLFPALGSLLTYTFLGEPTAPGQFTLEQTLHVFGLLYEA